MFKKLLKPALFGGAGLFGLVVVVGIGGHVLAQKQEAEMDAIATRFLQQYPSTKMNDSADEMARLAAKLGFSNMTGQVSEKVWRADPVQEKVLNSLEPDLRDYWRAQLAKTQGPLDPIPANIRTYLNDNQDDLTNLQNHLLTRELPIWDMDVELMGDFEYAHSSLFHHATLQNLLLLKAVNAQQQQQPAEMAAALKASQVLTEIIAQRPELIN